MSKTAPHVLALHHGYSGATGVTVVIGFVALCAIALIYAYVRRRR